MSTSGQGRFARGAEALGGLRHRAAPCWVGVLLSAAVRCPALPLTHDRVRRGLRCDPGIHVRQRWPGAARNSRPYRLRPDQRCTYGVSRSGAANGERNLHPLAALLWATFLIALLEALRATGSYPGASLFSFPQALALNLAGLVQTFVPTCAFFAALAGLATAREGSLRFERFRLIAYVLISAAVVGCAFRNLALYPPLAAYVPAWFAFVALFAFIAWTCLRESMPGEPAEGRWAALRYRFVPGLALGGALACLVLERFLYRQQYLSLHLGQLQVAHLLLGVGLWQVLARTPAVSGRTRRISWIVALVLLVGSAALASTSLLDPIRPYYLSRSVPGRAQAASSADIWSTSSARRV